MKYFISGFNHSSGVSYKKNPSGVPYDFRHLIVLVPAVCFNSETRQLTAYGYELMNIDIAPSVPDSAFQGLKYLTTVDFDVSIHRDIRGRASPVVNGLL